MSNNNRTVTEALESGDRAEVLRAVQRRLAEAIDAEPPGRDLPALTKQLAAVTAELENLPSKDTPDVVDDIAARRAARRSKTASQ